MKMAAQPGSTEFKRLGTPYASEAPPRRRLRIFALDPLAKASYNRGSVRTTIDIPNDDLDPGPCSDRIRVIDFDASLNVYYAPVNLDHPPLLMQDGLPPSESDPRFHQQMVYAVTRRVLENFERALGRTLAFKGHRPLDLYPHAFRGANAFFEPELNAVLFGYFSADPEQPGENLPGQTVFTCLSHDIIAHEVTHAILNRIRRHFNEPANQDVLAFHEAIADIVAIFQHFTIQEVLGDEIQAHHGELRSHSALLGLARQFGQATGMPGALRSALDDDGPQPTDYQTITEPHDRGALLVSAVFDAFFVGFDHRTRDIVKLATGGTGVLPDGDLPSDLVAFLAREAAGAAQGVLAMCIRALDYLPPVDVTFGDYLRALVTSDRDLFEEDRYGIRAAMIDAFRRRGIYPTDVTSLAEESLLWSGGDLAGLQDRDALGDMFASIAMGDDPDDAVQRFSDQGPNTEDGSTAGSPKRALAPVLYGWALANAERLGLEPAATFRVEGFHASFRIGSNGRLRTDLVTQFVQERPSTPEEADQLGGLRLFRGATVIFKQNGDVRYVITKPLREEQAFAAGREVRSMAMIRRFVDGLDQQDADADWRDADYARSRMIERASFALLDRHRGAAR